MAREKKYKMRIGDRESLRVLRTNVRGQESSGVFWAEDALETGAGELNANETFPLRGRIDDVDYTARGGKVGFTPARSVVRKRDPDFEAGADGNIEARDKCGAAAAQIFA